MKQHKSPTYKVDYMEGILLQKNLLDIFPSKFSLLGFVELSKDFNFSFFCVWHI